MCSSDLLRWPEEGHVAARIRALALREFREFVPPKFTGATIEDLQLQAEWQRGPVTFLIVASGSYTQEPGFTVRGELRGNSEGIAISNLTAASQSAPVITAHGFLPLTINPGALTNLLQWRPGHDLALKAAMQPDPQFWRRVAELTKVEEIGRAHV